MAYELITTPFGPNSTAAEVISGIDLTGRRAIVTGASSGIGLETARALVSAGAEVTLAVRDVEAGRRAEAEIRSSTDNGSILVSQLDLSDRKSVAGFVARWRGALNILVNNGGIMASPEMRTAEGWEMQFATNHLGHFALSIGLHWALEAAGQSRIVVVSSVGHLNGDVLFDDINFERSPYDPWKAYSQSKTANILFTVEAARRWAKDGIAVNALTPGRVQTQLTRHLEDVPAAPSAFQPGSAAIKIKNPQEGAATSVLLAASPLVEGVTGRYFSDCNEDGPQQPGERKGVAAYAVDPGKAARLWEISAAMLAS